MRIGINRLNLALLALFVLLIGLYSWKVLGVSDEEVADLPFADSSDDPGRYEEMEIERGELLQSGVDSSPTRLVFKSAHLSFRHSGPEQEEGSFRFHLPTLHMAGAGDEGLAVEADEARLDNQGRGLSLVGNVYSASGERKMWADRAVYNPETKIISAYGVPGADEDEGFVILKDGSAMLRARALKFDQGFENIELLDDTQVIVDRDLLRKGDEDEDR